MPCSRFTFDNISAANGLHFRRKNPCDHQVTGIVSILLYMPLGHYYFLFRARSTATAIATDAPTIGLLPIPRKPIISTCAGTEEEPAN